MDLIGRDRELERVRGRVRGPGPSLTLLCGPGRSGKTRLLRAALEESDTLWYQAVPLPDPDQRAILSRRLHRFREAHGGEPAAPGGGEGEDRLAPGADWPELFQVLAEHLYVTHRRTVVVLDDWHRLVEARSQIIRFLTTFWLEVRRRGVPLHLILASTPGAAVEPFRDPEDPLARWLDEDLRLGPLPYRDVTARTSGEESARDRLALYGVFGGWPDVIRHLEPGSSLEENLLRSVLGRDAPLLDWGADLLDREIQAPGRYASILRALGAGARSWGEIREGVPVFESSGRMAPYIQRLEELDLVEIVRSLDASPDSRSRRYRIIDPFAAFWFRFVLPHRTDLELGRASEVWSERIRPSLGHHLSLAFPRICRQWVEHYADEALTSRAREVGGLWGRDYDLEVAGTLTSGGVFYGRALWGSVRPGEDVVDDIDRQVDHTRYGFGREGRHRLVFADGPVAESLRRRAGRSELVHAFGPETLVGDRPGARAAPPSP